MGRFFKHLFITLAAFLAAAILFCVVVAASIAVAISSFAPEGESLKRGTVLEINMDEAFVDSPQSLSIVDIQNMLWGSTSKVSTLAMLRAMEVAATDPNITAISLRMDGMNTLSLAAAEELRTALEQFVEQSQKPIYAYAESYSQVEYYLASAADKIFVHPLGQIEWQGVATNILFYGDLISNIGARVEVFRPEACRFKSAVEPYSRGSMSRESREQSARLVDVLWDGVLAQVAHSRDLGVEELRRVAADEIVVEAQRGCDLGMVDVVAYENSYYEELESLGVVSHDGNIRRVSFANYAAMVESNNELNMMGGDKIAVIYIDGTIVDGRSEMGGSGESYVGSQSVVKQLREARFDDDIKGVVVRVNSPGGSAMAADVMWREVELLKEQKMVVVSMGSYAASGGYYISAPADAIIADRYTLTGSIGVYGMMLDYSETLSRYLHINIDGAQSSPSADFGRVPRAITPLERAAMMRSVDQIYESFTQKVAKGRNLPIGVVNALSGGQVWSGIEAASCGLVDGVGGLSMALGLIVDRCGLSAGSYSVVEIAQSDDELAMLLSSLGVRLQEGLSGGVLSIFDQQRSRIASDILTFERSNGLLMHSAEEVVF